MSNCSSDFVSKIARTHMPYYALRVESDDLDLEQIARQFNIDLDRLMSTNPGIEARPQKGEVIFISLKA